MSRRGLVINTLVALIAILITGGLAAQALIRDPSSASDSKLVAAGVEGREAFAIQAPEATAATRPTASTQPPPRPRPRPSTTTAAPRVAAATATTVPALPETTIPPVTAPPTTAAPVTAPPGGGGAACIPICWERRPPPAVAPSWTLTENGVTLNVRIEPAAPEIGDTVTIFYEATGNEGFCCTFGLSDPDQTIRHDPYTGPGCPPRSTAASGSSTVVMTRAGFYGFRLSANDYHLCQPPVKQSYGAVLYANFWVNPPA
jgi:hypothetical protein